jgi:hypothetical protein
VWGYDKKNVKNAHNKRYYMIIVLYDILIVFSGLIKYDKFIKKNDK